MGSLAAFSFISFIQVGLAKPMARMGFAPASIADNADPQHVALHGTRRVGGCWLDVQFLEDFLFDFLVVVAFRISAQEEGT